MSDLEANDLCVRIAGRTILNNVSACFARGKVTAIVGPNGAGKSTLLDCLVHLRTPQSGRVVLGGQDIGRISERQRARQVAYVPQNAEVVWAINGETFVGLGRTPYVGAWGLSRDDRACVSAALSMTDTEEYRHRVISTLSGGERARMMIARALAGQPEWLLADEPLAGLDPGHVLDMGDLFRKLARDRGCGIIVTLHDLGAALRIADRVIVLAQGQIIADAAPIEALTPDVLRQAYGIVTQTLDGANGPVLEVLGRGL
ncbi:ABC transporter ATP-binding protein [Brevundimonas terrae]|uniref:ABC transporter ATP-binding protein n=1 Tax=Brevundimonas terrae TaxID=363631 RepID=A0ABN0YJX0_9CAUL|nr:ABC transporter ATP-binding protein [Brevundimonas terrae]NIJ27446.1 iron complex transport system ATP-binding protein [Brevundimonas terrae]